MRRTSNLPDALLLTCVLGCSGQILGRRTSPPSNAACSSSSTCSISRSGRRPPNANNNVPPVAGSSPDGVLSVRQTTDQRTASASCRGCNAQLNPIGYTLNHHDALGQWQTAESGTGADGGTFTVPVDSARRFRART